MDLLLSSPVQCHIKVVIISLLMIVVGVNANEGQCLHEQHDNMVRFHCPVHHSYQKMMMMWTFREVSMPASKVFLSCRGGICREDTLNRHTPYFDTNLVLQDGNVVLNFMLTTYTITKLKVKCYKYFHYSRTDTKIWDISLTDNQESESKDEYFLPIFISLAVFVTILIFVVIVCLVCRRRKNSRPRLPRPRPTTSRVRDRVSTAARNTPQQTNVSLWLTQISAQLQTSSYIQRPPPYDEPPSYESLDHSAGHIAMRTISIINEGLSESRDFDLEPPPPYPTT